METDMQAILSLAAAAALTLGMSTAGVAASAQEKAPGQQMQDKGSKRGQPGASGYAPGQQDPTTSGQAPRR